MQGASRFCRRVCLALPLQRCFSAGLSCFPPGRGPNPSSDIAGGPTVLEQRCCEQDEMVLGSPRVSHRSTAALGEVR